MSLGSAPIQEFCLSLAAAWNLTDKHISDDIDDVDGNNNMTVMMKVIEVSTFGGTS